MNDDKDSLVAESAETCATRSEAASEQRKFSLGGSLAVKSFSTFSRSFSGAETIGERIETSFGLMKNENKSNASIKPRSNGLRLVGNYGGSNGCFQCRTRARHYLSK